MRWSFLLAVMIVACSGGGGGGEKPDNGVSDNGAQDIPGAPEATVDKETGCVMSPPHNCNDPWPQEGNCGVASEGCTIPPGLDLTGRWYRIDHLYVDSPKGPTDSDPHGAIAATLSCLWNTQIAKDELVILFHVTRHDPAKGEIDIEAGSGIRSFEGSDKCKYRFLANPAPQTVHMKLNGCTFESINGPDNKPVYGMLKIYPDLITSPIPVVNLLAHGAFSADGARTIRNGCLNGGICIDAAKAIDFKLNKSFSGCTNFFKFMDDFNMEANATDLPCADQSGKGYVFAGRFDATWIESDFMDQPKAITRDFSCNE